MCQNHIKVLLLKLKLSIIFTLILQKQSFWKFSGILRKTIGQFLLDSNAKKSLGLGGKKNRVGQVNGTKPICFISPNLYRNFFKVTLIYCPV